MQKAIRTFLHSCPLPSLSQPHIPPIPPHRSGTTALLPSASTTHQHQHLHRRRRLRLPQVPPHRSSVARCLLHFYYRKPVIAVVADPSHKQAQAAVEMESDFLRISYGTDGEACDTARRQVRVCGGETEESRNWN